MVKPKEQIAFSYSSWTWLASKMLQLVALEINYYQLFG